MLNGKTHYKWQCSIAFCMFTRGYVDWPDWPWDKHWLMTPRIGHSQVVPILGCHLGWSKVWTLVGQSCKVVPPSCICWFVNSKPSWLSHVFYLFISNPFKFSLSPQLCCYSYYLEICRTQRISLRWRFSFAAWGWIWKDPGGIRETWRWIWPWQKIFSQLMRRTLKWWS